MSNIPEDKDLFARVKFEIAKIQFNNLTMNEAGTAIEANPSSHKIAEWVCNNFKEKDTADNSTLPDKMVVREGVQTPEEILNSCEKIRVLKNFPNLSAELIAAMESYAQQFKQPLPEDISQWIRDEAEREKGNFSYATFENINTQRKAFGDIYIRGAEAVANLLSPQLQELKAEVKILKGVIASKEQFQQKVTTQIPKKAK